MPIQLWPIKSQIGSIINKMRSKESKQSKQIEIRRKLAQSAITSPQEYEQIISSLIGQRQRLQADLKVLRDKVVALQQKQAQKFNKTLRKRISPKKINLREELNRKYEELKQWQRKSLKAMKHPTMEMEYRAYFDSLFSIQQEIQLTLRQLNDELSTNKRLRKAVKLISKDEEVNNHAHDNMERENQLLKKRIFSLRKIVDRQLSKEVELQNYLIDTQERLRDRERQSRERYSRQRINRERERRERQQEKERQREAFIRQQKQQERLRAKSQISHQSIQSSDSEQIIDLDIQPNQITTREEVYQVEGRLNRIQKKYRTAVANIQRNIKRNYPNEALRQKREGSKLTFGKQFDLLLERVKTNLNCLNQLNKQKIKLFFLIADKNEVNNLSEERSVISSESSLLHSLKPEDPYNKRTIKVHTEGKGNSPFHRTSRVKSNPSQSRFQEKVMYAKARTDPVNAGMQTDSIQYYDHLRLRRDFIGRIDEHTIYDKLKLSHSSSIKTMEIYYTDRGIATVRAIYSIHSTNTTLEMEIMLPDPFIRNYCKVHVIDTTHDDFIRYFKLRYHQKENRVTSIKVVTNRGVKNGWGDSKIKEDKGEIDEELEKELVFDINEDEYAACIFCSHLQKGPYWYLTGFGVQIDEL